MDKQLIITIDRQYGSRATEICELIAKKYDIPFYGTNILNIIEKEKGLPEGELDKWDEKGFHHLTTRTDIEGYSNSPEHAVYALESEFLLKEAEEGKSFVVLGRCSDWILRDYNPYKFFICADLDSIKIRINELKDVLNLGKNLEAKHIYDVKYKQIKNYHNEFAKTKWGKVNTYDMILDSTKLGVENCAEMISEYINRV